jgi:O-antigen/teichoic acid export membrane protein
MPRDENNADDARQNGGTRTMFARVFSIASANACVAALGFVGSGLLLPRALDEAAFAATSLFLAAFQWGQEIMGRSLNWALLRISPAAEQQRSGGSDATIAGAWSLQLRLVGTGIAIALLAASSLRMFLDSDGAPSRAAMVALAGVAAAIGVVFWFDLGRLQLRERFHAMSACMAANSALRVCAWALLWAIGALSLETAIAAHLATGALAALLARKQAGPMPPLLDHARSAEERARLWSFSGRMILATALASTAAQVDLFLLDAQSDDAATGRLRIAVMFGIALELATSALMTALLPQAGRAATAEQVRAMLRRARTAGLAIAALAACSVPVVQWALPILLPRYADAANLYGIVCIGVAVTAATDPLGLSFVSRDKPGRFVLLSAVMLAIVVLGNLFAPGDDRAHVTAWTRTAGRIALGAGILFFVLRDVRSDRRKAAAAC